MNTINIVQYESTEDESVDVTTEAYEYTHNPYDELCLNTDASLENIERNYKTLMYKHKDNPRKLVNLNESYMALKDPYKREFIDNFFTLESILRTTKNAYFLTRFVTKANFLLSTVFLMCNVVNSLFLGLLFALESNLLRFGLFIFGPVFLIPILFSVSQRFLPGDGYIPWITGIITALLQNSITLVILCCRFNIYLFLGNEIVSWIVVLITIKSRRVLRFKAAVVLPLKTAALCLYYFDIGDYFLCIPVFIASLACSFGFYTGILMVVLAAIGTFVTVDLAGHWILRGIQIAMNGSLAFLGVIAILLMAIFSYVLCSSKITCKVELVSMDKLLPEP